MHGIVCQYGYTHSVCRCAGPHGNTNVLCNNPDHEKENSMTVTPTESVEELEERLAKLKGVTPEQVAAQATDEADDAYVIQPAADPDEAASDDDESTDVNAITAFLVIVDVNGTAFATGELDKVGEIVPARVATVVDMRRACNEVVHDVNAMQISNQTVALMQQSAQQLAEQARGEKMAAALAKKNIHVPGRR